MANKKTCFKDYFYQIDDIMSSKTRRKMNRKSHKGRWYGGVAGDQSGGDGGVVGESINLKEMRNGVIPGTFSVNGLSAMHANLGLRRWWNTGPYDNSTPIDTTEEELESTVTKLDMARSIFNSMVGNPNVSRRDIINAMMKQADVTESTAVSYYERIAKDAGLTNMGTKSANPNMQQASAGLAPTGSDPNMATSNDGSGQPGFEDMPPGTELENDLDKEIEHTFPDDPKRQGIIRVVDKAHLVYKIQTPDGTFEELWIYNISKNLRDEISIRKKILAGTDIPPTRFRSADGSQTYQMTTMGNAQYVKITGLPN